RKQLSDAVIQSRDIMFLPEYELMRIPKEISPYEYRLSNKNYPIEDIYSIASMSGIRSPAVASRQAKALSSKNNIVRYWAALGLRSQPDEILKPFKKEILRAGKDSFLPAAVTASAIGSDVFGDKISEENMKRFIASHDKNVALLAINYLLYMRNPEPFVAAVKSLRSDSEPNGNVRWAADDFLGMRE
ncbi:MAG TPA: sulfatase, partial [Sphingobacteriaceae bacterium]